MTGIKMTGQLQCAANVKVNTNFQKFPPKHIVIVGVWGI